VEQRLPRKLAAILYADVAGYSRLMGEDEDATHRTLRDYLDLMASTIDSHRGQVMHYAGDAMLAQFTAVLDALSSSVAIQNELRIRNEALPDERKVRFRIGVNLGDVIEDRGDIYGDGVNVAARLEALAEPAGICISDAVRTAIGKKLPFEYAFIGEQLVKNIEEPVRAYRVFEHGAETTAPPSLQTSTSVAATPLPFGKPSVTVKPFENVGADAEQDRLGDAFTNGIVGALTRIPGMVLVEDASPSMVKSKQMTVQEIGHRFEVRFVLKGAVQKTGDRIRVNAELTEVSSSRYLWAGNLDHKLRDFGDVFDLQDEIIEEIVTAMDVKLLGGEAARLVRRTLKDPTALESYYRGEDLLWHSTMKLEYREAQRLFEETIRLEPKSPVGYAAGALAYWMEAISGLSDARSRSLERATELAHEAISLDDVTGYAHMVMAHVHLTRQEYDEAMTEASRAVSDRPSCPATYAIKAKILTYLGLSTEAIEFAQYALRLTPVYPQIYPAILASAYFGAERYEAAIAAAKTAIDLDEHSVDPYLILAASNGVLGNTQAARSGAEKALKLRPDFSLAEFTASQPYKDQQQLDRLLAALKSAGLQ
jgi:class 3 adenylate cyclase/tetratricopeptide (TPR) repeat protein